MLFISNQSIEGKNKVDLNKTWKENKFPLVTASSNKYLVSWARALELSQIFATFWAPHFDKIKQQFWWNISWLKSTWKLQFGAIDSIHHFKKTEWQKLPITCD